jgi:hypothetical protein
MQRTEGVSSLHFLRYCEIGKAGSRRERRKKRRETRKEAGTTFRLLYFLQIKSAEHGRRKCR